MMKSFSQFTVYAIIAGLTVAGVLLLQVRSEKAAATEAQPAAQRPGHTAAMPTAAQKDIVDTAVGAGQFKTLVTAVQAAELVDVLKGKGPFTVFAPTDAAFAKVPQDQLEALLKDKKSLAEVLTYHVVPAKVTASDILKVTEARTVLGKPMKIAVKVNDANVIKTDIECTNGVIHVIDRVLLPPQGK